jgi:hypothetical protein
MKKFRMLMFFAALFLIIPSGINAQVSVNININAQPQWGPDEYDYVDYYYLPEAGIYYYAPKKQFIYRQGNRWVFTYKLPYIYRNLDLFSTYKVVINEPRPYLRNSYYTSHYRKYRNYHSKQGNIRDSRNPRFNRGNANHGNPGSKMDVGHKSQNRDIQPRPGVRGKNEHATMNDNRNVNRNHGDMMNKSRGDMMNKNQGNMMNKNQGEKKNRDQNIKGKENRDKKEKGDQGHTNGRK